MDYMGIGDTIDYDNYNMIVYMLRKFKRLKSNLRFGTQIIESDYGTYNIRGGLTNIDGNYIIESPVTITSNDVLLNCFYTFNFTVIDVNTSGTVNKRIISFTGNTNSNGELNILLLEDSIQPDEVILPDFTVDIIFDEHEYYTPISDANISLTSSKTHIIKDETNIITLTAADSSDTPISGVLFTVKINGVSSVVTTDDNGEATITYTGLGNVGKVVVECNSTVTIFYDGGVTAEYTGDNIRLGYPDASWLISNGNVIVDWGDGTRDTINNPTLPLTHTYSDSQEEHRITLIGDITSLGDFCFNTCTGLTEITIPDSVTSLGVECFFGCTGLTSIIIPEGVTSLGEGCFFGCTNLTSISIPYSVTSLGHSCFKDCTSLIDYQLYWTGNDIIKYNPEIMATNNNTIFTIPLRKTSDYLSKNYPLTHIVERTPILTQLQINVPLNLVYSDDFNVTGVLTDANNNPIPNQHIQFKINNVTIMGTTDINGSVEFKSCPTSMNPLSFQLIYAGAGVYAASFSQVVHRTVNKETSVITVNHPLNEDIYYTDETILVDGVLTDDDGEVIANKTININIGD